ncbi:MAG: hypothetical protein A3I88_02095 [Candidatus Portnoybacteria bacterium RIFCSPLOWO2_12_FULL_39_9]|uniref:Uncharacterized protein n=1 Tax=Candidatus Portnoybacteria bacterium RIFCSPHIGHO2_12_FULL_38_9 TaxID=1801997 RepID=A0A1G2FFD9_9BACT|nr:MAG: hypothetical protein A3H00_01025 [Candidatus Portnoybacteria bacterium RBG_13_40_8]OGZ36164.1 MAG: hypothetical protein A2646_01045 [Candidatus Portnoybacteria bacterium RIFCSPHIGHO2_02_FULL_39_12]OGZ36522.1 MAG: hypothetical protein A3J64_02770 [Candidatus Portnoybacteria bacterium RIFCSPHIGHO2_12_FULL_38_9]OGZ38531.1 MAG: hypothetical protein A3F21_02280 [Candidatus Portnoybacteria bacterium RIFCSPLOWO2_01_FULL_38_39]OGZ41290.1 MAG: hypothetical protein A3I88_02095 [Candidatus Portnoy
MERGKETKVDNPDFLIDKRIVFNLIDEIIDKIISILRKKRLPVGWSWRETSNEISFIIETFEGLKKKIIEYKQV